MKYLITGSSGFIGFHLTKALCEAGHIIVGIDNMNHYYDVELKKARLEQLIEFDNFTFHEIDLINQDKLYDLFRSSSFERVIHLAAQAGVRYSLQNPMVYINSNLIGHFNILEACKLNDIQHLIFASSSSVYGLNRKLPFSVNDPADHPVSLYAATKKSNELMSHSYSHLYDLPVTGLRFFTVYGPWGRPDMALFKFTKAILEGNKIEIYNQGNLQRDFTYIDDVVHAVTLLLDMTPQKNEAWNSIVSPLSNSSAPYKIFNVGNSYPIKLMDFINTLEKVIGLTAEKEFLPMQPGDVEATHADVTELYELTGYRPKNSLEKNLESFVDWYKRFYHFV